IANLRSDLETATVRLEASQAGEADAIRLIEQSKEQYAAATSHFAEVERAGDEKVAQKEAEIAALRAEMEAGRKAKDELEVLIAQNTALQQELTELKVCSYFAASPS